MNILLVDTVSVGHALYREQKARLDYVKLVEVCSEKIGPITDKFAFFGNTPRKKSINFAWFLEKQGWMLLYRQTEGEWLDILRRMVVGQRNRTYTILTADTSSKFMLIGQRFNLVTVVPVKELEQLALSVIHLPGETYEQIVR